MRAQVKITMDILKNWDCLKDLTKSDKEYIEWQLNYIGDQAILEYREGISKLGDKLLVTNKNK